MLGRAAGDDAGRLTHWRILMYDDQQPAPEGRARTRTIVAAVGVGAVGLVAGGVLAGTLSSASAESATSTGYGRGGYGVPGGDRDGDGHGPRGGGDPSKAQNPDEKLLTGTTRAKVLAAVKEKYRTATVQRVETDSDGVYEAHVVTKAGDEVSVQVGKDFAVTGTQTGHGGGPGGHGDHDGDGPGVPGTEGAPTAPPSA